MRRIKQKSLATWASSKLQWVEVRNKLIKQIQSETNLNPHNSHIMMYITSIFSQRSAHTLSPIRLSYPRTEFFCLFCSFLCLQHVGHIVTFKIQLLKEWYFSFWLSFSSSLALLWSGYLLLVPIQQSFTLLGTAIRLSLCHHTSPGLNLCSSGRLISLPSPTLTSSRDEHILDLGNRQSPSHWTIWLVHVGMWATPGQGDSVKELLLELIFKKKLFILKLLSEWIIIPTILKHHVKNCSNEVKTTENQAKQWYDVFLGII